MRGGIGLKTDTSEKGLEDLIVAGLTGSGEGMLGNGSVHEGAAGYGVGGWILGLAYDYNRDYALDLAQLSAFLAATQPELSQRLCLMQDSPVRQKFLARLQGEITKRGVIDVLRRGIKHGPDAVSLYYATPSPNNLKAAELFVQNRFSVTRQLRYSKDETRLALDLCLFINGLPLATFELKNRLTKQTVDDAVEQYKRDRSHKELLFQFGRCAVHFAMDDQEVQMCPYLKGKDSWFLPFNKGWNDGAGNPPNPSGIKTAYLWQEILSQKSLADIIENYAQIVVEKDDKGNKKTKQIFPRYHQLDVVRKLLAATETDGVGKRYLIQHSAGSGKSNSIAWLAHQLISREQQGKPVFDSIIVVTDRIILDKQIRDTIKSFAQVSSVVGHAKNSGDLRHFLKDGKKIIISTAQKFPAILKEIGDEHRGHKFAIIIDEAHSGQGGRTTAGMNVVLGEHGGAEGEESTEDIINRLMESHKMLGNASYFAFTATPKNKTLEIFGEPYLAGEVIKHKPFHSYTMKQAIQERFILDVLQNYTPVASYYRLMKKVEDDPEFDARKAQKKIRHYVESHDHAIRQKAEIMIDHFHEKVAAYQKIGGKARSMVITNGIARAVQYYQAFGDYLKERKSPYRALIAFSGEQEVGGKKMTEAGFNGFASHLIPERFKEDPYRFLIVADKFQTGYDEPLLHTMYVDKTLAGIKAVQTLSRLNRAHPAKHDTFVLDFMNDTVTIQAAFADYYRTTILSEETDPNKLHDLKSDLDAKQVYHDGQIDSFVALYLGGASREKLDPILDACVAIYKAELVEDDQVDFKGKAKAFCRTYAFLSAVLPYKNASWEKLSIFLNFLIPKLPAPEETDLSKGILQAIDMDSYRVEVKASMKILLPDEDSNIGPVPVAGGGFIAEPELDRLSNIIKAFNDQFSNIDWKDADKICKILFEEVPAEVAADKAFQNARNNSDKQNARIEHDKAIERAVMVRLADHTELFKQYSDNPSFRKWWQDMVFAQNYDRPME